MNLVDKDRNDILSRIRSGTHGSAVDRQQVEAAYAALARTYIRESQLAGGALCELMVERLREYDAEVVECAKQELPKVINSQLTACGRRTFVVPAQVPADWLPMEFNWKVDEHLTTSEIEAAEGTLTGAFCGIAESGTIVLHHTGRDGRRSVSLLPDWHLCVLYASQIVETLPEYFNLCQSPPALATYISGPSATADIEMTRIKGVHGPRFLVVILVRDI
jgi:L-lactate dehydrogenase complex protein LldG